MRKCHSLFALSIGLATTLPATAQDAAAALHVDALASGTLLRVQLDRTAKMTPGTPVTGHLLDSVYLIDREVLTAGSIVTGRVVTSPVEPAKDRVWQLLDGDVTPTRDPHIVFDTITVPHGPTLAMTAPATERTATLVHMRSAGKHCFAPISMIKEQAHQSFQRAHDTYIAPGKKDRFEQFIFDQLPYHPQRIWRASQFDAELSQPLDLQSLELHEEAAGSRCANVPGEQLPAMTLHARLLTGISSKDAKAGETVDAMLAQPVYASGTNQLLLPEGAHLQGSVLQAKPARMFGRTGVLRFNLKQVSVPPEESCAGQERIREVAIHSQLTGIEGSPDGNVSLDSEGEAKAGASPNRVLAPLVLGLLAGRTMGDDGNNAGTGAVSGGGFGLAGRVVSLSTRDANVTAGFAYYAMAKSLVRRWVLRGHEVEFPRNTRFDIEVSPREGSERPMR